MQSFTSTLRSVSRSVLPQAFLLSLCAVVVAVFFKYLLDEDILDLTLDGRAYTLFSSSLGFLLVFRNGKAYSRWWDGVMHLNDLKMDWVGACNQACAATSCSKQPKEKVAAWRQVLVRQFSLLSCVAFKHIADMHDEHFEVLNIEGFDEETKKLLLTSQERPRHMMPLISQWLMNTLHRGMDEGIVSAPPPIVNQFFTHLHKGTSLAKKCHMISFTAFPLPYSIMVYGLLAIHFIFTAAFCALTQPSVPYMCCLVFFGIFSFNGINMISAELERPFGDDVNDINLHAEQRDINHHLMLLLDARSLHKPHCHSLSKMREGKPFVWSTDIMKNEHEGSAPPQDSTIHVSTMADTGTVQIEAAGKPSAHFIESNSSPMSPVVLAAPKTPEKLDAIDEQIGTLAKSNVTTMVADDALTCLFRDLSSQQKLLAASISAHQEQLSTQILEQLKMQERHNSMMVEIANSCRLSLEDTVRGGTTAQAELVRAIHDKDSGKYTLQGCFSGQQGPSVSVSSRRSPYSRSSRFPA